MESMKQPNFIYEKQLGSPHIFSVLLGDLNRMLKRAVLEVGQKVFILSTFNNLQIPNDILLFSVIKPSKILQVFEKTRAKKLTSQIWSICDQLL